VLFAGKTFALNEEYIAGWFSMFPAVHLTPFVGIHSVPPSSYVLLQSGKSTTRRYWDFDPDRRIRYPTDAEYEEHFRTIFGEAVRRRLRSDCPVLAELSGGRDSSSIVCVADAILTRGTAETPRLDTISYYDDSEPNWNERPYFTKVEEQRGRTGWHINIGSKKAEEQCKSGPLSRSRNNLFMSTPGHGAQPSQQFQMCLASQGNRVMLSGTGGDETMGGVPTPTPELQDTLARAQFRALAHQLKAWALEKRKPWFHLLFEAARGFFPPTIVGVTKARRPASWLQSNFAKHHWLALTGYPSRVKLFSASPVFQENVSTLDTLRRQLACKALPLDPLYEKRYPYLDRGLLEFTFAIPREQLVRPTQRRSLMRRALVGTVPNGILDRKRKAFAVRTPMLAISRDWVNLVEATQHMVSAALGIVDPERISDVLEQARRGREVHMVQLMRTIYSESWLRNLSTLGIVDLG
jgi:asparagine synthase (glutamine-hydrolysing)